MAERKAVMLCSPFDRSRLLRWPKPWLVQPKFQGKRCRAIMTFGHGGDVSMVSSQSNPITCLPKIKEQLIYLTYKVAQLRHENGTPVDEELELDGELWCPGMSEEEIVGICGRTKNLSKDHERIGFYIFDLVCKDTQFHRTVALHDLSSLVNRTPNIHFVDSQMVTNEDTLFKTFDSLITNGFEGIVVRNPQGKYVRKRSTNIMKMKATAFEVSTIVSFEEEESIDGVPKGSLGAMWVRNEDGKLYKVGTGFTRDERDTFWDTQDKLKGRRIKVKYFTKSEDGMPKPGVFTQLLEDGK